MPLLCFRVKIFGEEQGPDVDNANLVNRCPNRQSPLWPQGKETPPISADLWQLERHLTQRRKEIDRKYEFRFSRLTDVLGRLLYENRLNEEDVRGLGEDKMQSIRSFANFLRDSAA